jgi:hypothetical protein
MQKGTEICLPAQYKPLAYPHVDHHPDSKALMCDNPGRSSPTQPHNFATNPAQIISYRGKRDPTGRFIMDCFEITPRQNGRKGEINIAIKGAGNDKGTRLLLRGVNNLWK